MIVSSCPTQVGAIELLGSDPGTTPCRVDNRGRHAQFCAPGDPAAQRPGNRGGAFMRCALPDPIDPMPRAAPAVSVVELDTQALVARIRAGDVAAFERVYRAQHAPLCAFVARYVSAPDRAA